MKDTSTIALPPQPMQDKNAQQRSLTRAYIGALGIIAVLTIVNHGLTSYIARTQKESATIVFTLTNLRSLAGVIVSQSAAYKTSKSDFDHQLLVQSIAKIKQEHAAIEAQDGTMKDIFHAAPYVLNKTVADLVTTAENFTQRNANTEALAGPIFRLEQVLTINIDLALEKYQTDIIMQLAQFFKLQYLSVFFVLLVLFLEALFIFRPLVRRLGEYHQDLLRLALTDALTGLNNRRAFMQQANAGVDHFKRHKKPFALVLTDLDKFKTVNDVHGHKIGDLVLQHYSRLMRQSLRGHDIFGRIGGEEFGIFLPETTAQDARLIIERFRKTVMDTPCPYVDKNGTARTLNYTSSFGIAAVTAGVWAMDSLFTLADENLYKAKDQGRNCVVMEELGKKPDVTAQRA